LTRLVHAVAAGLVQDGCAIDEGTCVAVSDEGITVHGVGSAYRITRADDGSVGIDVHRGRAHEPLA
jgi:cyanophycinase